MRPSRRWIGPPPAPIRRRTASGGATSEPRPGAARVERDVQTARGERGRPACPRAAMHDAPGILPPMRTILRARRIYTLDAARPQAEALLIEGSRIAALGTDADGAAWRRPGDRVLDWRDAVAVPGLVDYHVHLRGYALQRTAVELHGVRSV